MSYASYTFFRYHSSRPKNVCTLRSQQLFFRFVLINSPSDTPVRKLDTQPPAWQLKLRHRSWCSRFSDFLFSTAQKNLRERIRVATVRTEGGRGGLGCSKMKTIDKALLQRKHKEFLIQCINLFKLLETGEGFSFLWNCGVASIWKHPLGPIGS